MGKKIRLTETELINLIKRVIKEQPSVVDMVTSASDWGLSIGPGLPDSGIASEKNCDEEFEDYEFVANSFNWCRYDSKADKYSWEGNWAANQVKTDVQTTSSQDLITPALKTISTAKDFCQFVNSYYKFKGDLYNDIDSLFSLIDACDFVITISNINAHIAGALGKKTFLLAPFSKGRIWYWHDGLRRSLWYPSVEIFSQTDAGDWSVPINEIKEKIVEEIAHE